MKKADKVKFIGFYFVKCLQNCIFALMDSHAANRNRKNLLLRYKAIMEEFDKYDCRTIPITTIWRKYIFPKFHISRETLYKIFNTDIEGELRSIEECDRRVKELV